MIINRLRLADRETMAIETLHVRESLVPGLTAPDLERSSFYEILEGRFGITIVGGDQTIEPTVTNEEESEALGVPLHSPALLFERITRASTGAVIGSVPGASVPVDLPQQAVIVSAGSASTSAPTWPPRLHWRPRPAGRRAPPGRPPR